MKRLFTAALLVGLLAGAACGGDNGGPTNPSPPGGDPSFSTVTGNIGAFEYVAHQYNATRNGNLTITLTWQGNTDLDLHLTAANCQDIYGNNACTRLATSEQVTGNSETISRAVQSGEQFRVWVDSFATVGQAYTVTFNLQ